LTNEGNHVRLSRTAILSAAGAAFVAALARPAQTFAASPEIIISGSANEAAGNAFYANDLGYFQKAGLNVKLTVLTTAAPMVAAVVSGSVAISGIPIPQIALARAKGIPIVMIAPGALYMSSVPTNGLIALKDSPLKQAADLNGKTIATRDVANMAYIAARAWIDKNGGDSKSVHWLETADPTDVAALQSGRIDAASIGEPAFDDALRSGGVKVLARAFDAIAPRFLINAFCASESFVKENPDVVRRFADTIQSASHWANQTKNHPQSAQIIARYTMASVLPDSTRVVYAEQSRASDLQPVLDALLTYGFLKAPMRAGDLVSSLTHLA
jgi:ABC-type nitrate/sulfonate/bicarbonate transport system substrate-binding protein